MIMEKATHTGFFSAANIARRKAVLARVRQTASFKAKMHAALEKRLHNPAYRARMRALAKARYAKMDPTKKRKLQLYLLMHGQ
jgi:hypothetical protein